MPTPAHHIRRYGGYILRGAIASVRLLPPRIGVMVAEAVQGMHIRVPIDDHRTAIIVTPNALCAWRARTLHTKEPETIRWMNTFRDGDVFWDVGANIGLYSLYAGIRGARVRAFEPDALNYALLNRNIAANQLDHRIAAYAVAVHDRDCVQQLHIQHHQWGGALSAFSEPRTYDGASFTPVFRQGAFGYTLDTLVAQLEEVPQHIKVDVDGNEAQVLQGATRTLRESSVRSLLIELDETRPDYQACLDRIVSYGFALTEKTHASMFDTGVFARTFNHVFVR
ncbi:MAG: FkbM family methyltransferase [bacterium]|nr:FkbM family methyltransferase [bacterium]